jgi:AcrR family transcriptional regulator
MGAKTPKTSDRRVERTRRVLREALVALIHERGWEGFSVQDVCDRADVGRSTFYLHFADKDDLLGGAFDDLRRALRTDLAAGDPGRPLGFTLAIVRHAYENQRLFRAVVGKKSGHVVQGKFRELVLDLVREDLSALGAPAPRRDALGAFAAGAFLELLTWSLEERSPPAAEALDALFHELVQPALQAARSRRQPGGDFAIPRTHG